MPGGPFTTTRAPQPLPGANLRLALRINGPPFRLALAGRASSSTTGACGVV